MTDRVDNPPEADMGNHQRVGAPAMSFPPSISTNFGPGIGNQPSHTDLLREARGVFDMGQRAIANRIASLELQVTSARRDGDGKMIHEVIDDHPLKIGLLDKPHPNITTYMLLRLAAQWVTSVGEAHWLKVGSPLGVPVELHPIPPTAIKTVWRSGVVSEYVVTDGNGNRTRLDPDAVVHFYFPDPERFWGSEGYLGPSGVTSDTLKFAGEHLREHYRNDATPKTVIKSGSMPTPEERRAFEEAWRARYHQRTGTARGLPAYIPADSDLIQMALQSGADLVPLLEYLRDEQLMGVGVPRSILGQVVSGDRSSAEVNQYVFDRYTVRPIARLIEDALTAQLAVDFDKTLKIRFAEFVSADKDYELRREEQDLRLKVVSINKVREKRGDTPVDWGERPVGTLAEVPYTGVGFSDDLPGDDAAADRAQPQRETEPAQRVEASEFIRLEWQRQVNREKKYIPGFVSRMRSVFRKQRDETLRRLAALEPRQRVAPSDLFTEGEWREVFENTVEKFRVAAFTDIVTGTLGELGGVTEFIFTEAQTEVLRRQGADLVRHVNSATKNALSRELAEATLEGESIGQIEKRIKSVFTTRRGQARTIARTEVLKASQEAQITAFEVSEVVDEKMWNHSMDAPDPGRMDHQVADGQVVGLHDSFTLGDGERADAPGIGAGGGSLSAGNTINCRCFVTPVRLNPE